MLNIGDTIILEIDEGNEEEKKRFKCRLVDRVKEFLFIDYPINEKTKRVGFFHDGTQFNASFIGRDQVVYLFQTELLARKKGNIPMLVLKDPGKESYIRIQRRHYVRVNVSIDVAVHPLKVPFSPFASVTADLSGGGIALILPNNQYLPVGKQVQCWLSLHMQSGEIKYIKTTCHVIRIISEKNSPREKACMQFVEINEGDRQTIIRYCFERQLYLRKKGIIE